MTMNASALPTWMKVRVSPKSSVSGMVPESRGRTWKVGGPAHQLLSPNAARTSAAVGPAAERSATLPLNPPEPILAHAARTVAANVSIATRRQALIKLQHRHERLLG